jgi:enoyl-CoA hydratase
VRYESIAIETTNGIGHLTLNRPDERNAMTPTMGEEIHDAVEAFNKDPNLRVVVVTGAGRAFSAGGDLGSLAKEAGLQSDSPDLGGGAKFYNLFLSVRRLAVPSIAAINGHAIGAGLCFALGCDMRVMHERAQVGMTFVKIGIHPGMAATWNLPRLIGHANAADLLYTGRLVRAEEALAMGLVNRIAGDDFDNAVAELASAVAANGPVSIRALKQTLAGTEDRDIQQAIEREAEAQAMTFRTADAREGIQAIMDKRAPKFEGR